MSRLDDLRALTAKTKKPLAWYGLAMEYRGLGMNDDAVATFKRVHELDAGYVAAYFMCAQLLAELGRDDDARAELAVGMAQARTAGDGHALGEMQALLDSLD